MLTDARVRNAKPRPKAYKIADANRLFLMVTPSGGKLWRWNYEYDGKNKTMAFGAYPLVVREQCDFGSGTAQGHSRRAVASCCG
ncbi:Arm DNA-binding domain-containing protein, partial [Novosphingobium sp. PC22D]|uniref:Arm DNA-binding domain-containing protein n=1 Tax=Novosphingobium sp. PC22D TaxID=1962403 RepID=UPI0011460750